jgi:DNA-binding YbaB/EbfC family protein
MTMDFDKLAAQAMKMQEELQRLQEEAAQEQVTATAGGGLVKVTATAGGEILKIEIDPKAIDPDDPELLADVVTAAVNQALRDGRALLESKVSGLLPGGLDSLGLGNLPGM